MKKILNKCHQETLTIMIFIVIFAGIPFNSLLSYFFKIFSYVRGVSVCIFVALQLCSFVALYVRMFVARAN